MGLFDFFDSEKREQDKKFKKARSLSYHDAEAGVKAMGDTCRTPAQAKAAAAIHWREVKNKKGEKAAFEDETYKKLMGKAYS